MDTQHKINGKNTIQKYLSKLFHFEKGPNPGMFTVHKTQTYCSHKKCKILGVLHKGLIAGCDLDGISAYGYICIEYSLILPCLYTHLTSNIHTLSGN